MSKYRQNPWLSVLGSADPDPVFNFQAHPGPDPDSGAFNEKKQLENSKSTHKSLWKAFSLDISWVICTGMILIFLENSAYVLLLFVKFSSVGSWSDSTECLSGSWSDSTECLSGSGNIECPSKSGSAKYSCCKLQVRIEIQNIKLKYHSPLTDCGRSNIKTKHKVHIQVWTKNSTLKNLTSEKLFFVR
jgi:hypothetical protein